MYNCLKEAYIVQNNNNLLFIKDAHHNSVFIACRETSVRVCFGGVNSRYTFQKLKRILFLGDIL